MKPVYIYLLKVTEFCNLNCPYCYMFNLKDSTPFGKPRLMPLDVVADAAPKMAALAAEQGVKELTVCFHGGEPMLAGQTWFRQAVSLLRSAAGQIVELRFFLQSNGLLINESWLDLFEELEIRVGLSMDGPSAVHDRVRVDHSGRGSYAAVVRGLKLLQSRDDRFTGVLCVIDPATDGLEIYRHFRQLGIERMDFLWPLDYNWNTPPPALADSAATPYADYLIPIFDEWWREENKRIRIRYFDQILLNLLGGRGGLDSLGGNPVSITTIDSDGSLGPVDSLRACGDGFTELGLNVREHSLSALYDSPLFQVALAGQVGLCEACRACPFHDVCGGGYLPHRYSDERGFSNPSVYCRDLWKLITHILEAVAGELPVGKGSRAISRNAVDRSAIAFDIPA